MSIGLLDVSALIALLWEEHPFHRACAEWFARESGAGWATCPITQAGCARILSNPAFTANPPSVQAVIAILKTATRPGLNHHFWPDSLPLSALRVDQRSYFGHKQVTDAYLLALAMHHQGLLITFDRRMLQLAPEGTQERKTILLLSEI